VSQTEADGVFGPPLPIAAPADAAPNGSRFLTSVDCTVTTTRCIGVGGYDSTSLGYVPLVETMSSGVWTVDGPAWPAQPMLTASSYVAVACGGGASAGCAAAGTTVEDTAGATLFESTGSVAGLPTSAPIAVPLPVPFYPVITGASCPPGGGSCVLAGEGGGVMYESYPLVVTLPGS
jgi:hypothetical protein